MTAAPRETRTNRLLDVVFGKRDPRISSEQIAALSPPRRVQLVMDVSVLLSFVGFILAALAKEGWLPFAPKIESIWAVVATGAYFVALIVHRLVSKHYERVARAAKTAHR